LRDRLAAAFTGRPYPGEQFQAALESGVVTMIRNAAADAAEQAAQSWRAHPAGAALLAVDMTAGLTEPSPDLHDRAERLVRDWQRGVLDLVRREAQDKLALARASAYVVNATGLLVMVSVFAATAFLPTGLEVALGAGTTVAGQKLLEAIFGDQAVRSLAQQARTDLLTMVRALLDEEAGRFGAALATAKVDPTAPDALRSVAVAVAKARRAAKLPQAEAVPPPTLHPAVDK
jgi:hypothetical protein